MRYLYTKKRITELVINKKNGRYHLLSDFAVCSFDYYGVAFCACGVKLDDYIEDFVVSEYASLVFDKNKYCMRCEKYLNDPYFNSIEHEVIPLYDLRNDRILV